MYSDPIADMLTRIRNANRVFKEHVDIPSSKLKRDIAKVLKSEGFIRDHKYIEDGKQGILRIYLKYYGEHNRLSHVIKGIERVSHTGRRIYHKNKHLPRVMGGLGIAILTTSRGVMSDKEARNQGLGGEILAKVW
ncbi:MAG: 30S ribosomal protein S8 [Thermotoga sp.]|nr:30S ribosomal protein S8 [Thermotogota bacterium]RKX54896.1 MAG: 30S ribosomal protein S8 [Thermotoga sp.]